MNQEQQPSKNLLLEPYQLGDLLLPNKLIMASLTRMQCDPKTLIPSDINVKYYAQRASAGFILSECTPIAQNGNCFPGCGGMFTKEQVQGWKRVTDAVHTKGGLIFNQIWHAGRAAHPTTTGGEGNIAPSALAIRANLRTGVPHVVPKEMTLEDVKLVQEQFRQGLKKLALME